MARTILRLYLIHCSAILAIAFSMYFPGLDLLLSFLYLALLWQEASRSIYKSQPIKQGLIGFLWQMPGIILVLAVCLGWDFSVDFSYYFIFMLELWQTPVLPFISLLPAWIWHAKPLYYYLLMLMVPLLIIFYFAPACQKGFTPLSTEKMNPLA